jgi:Rieske Fe-S protein
MRLVGGEARFEAHHAVETSRRTFLAQVIGACLAFVLTVLGIPAIGAAVGPAFKREEAEWLSLGNPDGFEVGVPKAVNLTVVSRDGWIETTLVKGTWVVRDSDAQFMVFNGRCTHLGCAYSWQAAQHQFACPCHAGVFALDGRVLTGPPPRGLDLLESRVEAGELQVRFQDFRLGISDRLPA